MTPPSSTSPAADASSLAGQVALITGGSRGIGLAIARLLSAAGARVAITARDPEPLSARALELGALALPCDVKNPAAVGDALARLRAELGDPSILINNAGTFRIGSIEETTEEQFEEIVHTNLSAPFALARAVIPAMRSAGRGHVVTIGSIADRTVFPGNAAYAAAKHGVRAMHEALRLELRGSGVRTSLVSPGPVDTAIWDPIDPDNREGFTPRSQMLRPDAVAEAVLWCLTRPLSVNVDELRLSHS